MDLPGIISFRVERLKFKANNLDLALALVATFLLPVACMLLLDWSGALIPLILYYGVFCFALVYFRKGSLEYYRPMSWVLPLFLFLLLIQALTQVAGALTIIPSNDELVGVLLTLLIWVPLNAFTEQLLWVYIFDSFETRWTERKKRLVGGVIGILLTLVFVGMIHALFWGSFLPSFESVAPWSYIFFATQFIITPGYLFLYRRSGSMWPIFAIHIVADATLVITAQYSIIPNLWTF
ncbi:MAG: CPBP family glutamic-type intramembrane protease [Methanomassiliicoccales archaeon]|nr:CPBP family glutamic-type intramembrane protease [Methanomassiliicoccales archaeon]